MREIKFRAWFRHGHKMIDLLKITPLALESPEQKGLFIPFDKNLFLMQYTGLRDRNGKEIYEGDVVINSQGTPYEVVYGIGLEPNNPNYVGFILRRGNVNELFEWSCGEIEVIGNIYENPELLK